MTPEQWQDIKHVLQTVLEIDPAERAAFLDAQQPDVRREVSSLLRSYEANSTFLEAPARAYAIDSAANGSAAGDSSLIGKTFGPYRVLSLLGQGGMGSVWLAERNDGMFARQVALKLVHPALMGRVMAERVSREREILASLNHPNIARLFDAGFAEDGQPYLALEYIAGTPFTAYCDDRRLSIGARLTLFRQVLTAVQYAHAHLVIHRDLKPSNILVTQDGQVQLLDFGIAKLLTEGEARETALTLLGGRALTPDYAAPEQIMGTPITTAADVYSLGVMLYELLTSERPYRLKRDSRGALEDAILKADPVPPSRALISEAAAAARTVTPKRLAKALKGDLDTIVIKALKKSPVERYATVDAFGGDIARFLSGDVVLARPDSVVYHALKFARRNWIALTAASALILILAAGLAATSYEAQVAATQRDAALQAQLSSLTQTAAARLKDGGVAGALDIILQVLAHPAVKRAYTPEALSIFQEARAADRQAVAISGHADRVRYAAFSPDGRRIITASLDNTARTWDAATGRQLMLLDGHTDALTSASFSPDGTRLLTSSEDKSARLWDAATGRQLLLLSGHSDVVNSAVFSPEGGRLATASFDRTARIWDAAGGRQILILGGHSDRVYSAAFSPDGRRLATASRDKTARIWNASTGQQILILGGHTDRVFGAAFSPDGARVVTASADKTARVWDAATGRQLLLLSGHTDRVYSAVFSPDGRRLATASDDKTARIWDAATGRQLLSLSGHSDNVVSAAFSPDGRRLVTSSDDKTARIWEIAAGREILMLSGHADTVYSVAFSPDGRRLVSASDDKSARVWDAQSGRQVLALIGHTDTVYCAAFSPDGRLITTASADKTARIWDAASAEQTLLLSGHADRVTHSAFSPDGRRIVTASTDHTARIWDAASGGDVTTLRGHADNLDSAEFSPDGLRVATASDDNSARIWDAATGRQLVLLSGHSDAVYSAVFSPDGRRLLTTSGDRTARIWDAATGEQLLVLSGHSDRVGSARFSPDGLRLVTVSDDKTARLWDAATGEQLLVLSGHTESVESAAFSPDGLRVATGSSDKAIRIWDARAPALDVQIRWAEAAQLEELSRTQRAQLGLPIPEEIRRWPWVRSKCDEAAAAPYDPQRHAPGAMADRIVADIALTACASAVQSSVMRAQALYQQARALAAGGSYAEAKRGFEEAIALGYRAAQLDLAMLLSQPSTPVLDVTHAVSMYEQAWRDGVIIAAFELGTLYEHGMRDGGLAADAARAWAWYKNGAAADEPNALARFAEREDAAADAETDPAAKNRRLLGTFKYYAAAAERARREDWPDEAWRTWRYRRASLARTLAREGMMEDVAHAYDEVRGR